MKHVQQLIDRPVVWAPSLRGGIAVSLRGGDFKLICGRDASIGYLSHDEKHVCLYLEESFSAELSGPEAAVPLLPRRRHRRAANIQRSARRLAREQREAAPAPHAIDVAQSGGAHPVELRLDRGEAVLGIAVGAADRVVEPALELLARALDDLEIGEQATGPQRRRDLAEQRLLALVLEVVDREAGHDHVERAQRGDRLDQIVRRHRHASIPRKARARRGQHRLGAVDRDHRGDR